MANRDLSRYRIMASYILIRNRYQAKGTMELELEVTLFKPVG